MTHRPEDDAGFATPESRAAVAKELRSFAAWATGSGLCFAVLAWLAVFRDALPFWVLIPGFLALALIDALGILRVVRAMRAARAHDAARR